MQLPLLAILVTSFSLQGVLGLSLLCLTIHNLTTKLKSVLRAFYLGDGTLGVSVEEVLADFRTVKNLASEVCQDLN